MKDLEKLLELDHPDCHSTDWTRKEYTGVPLVLASARLVGASIAGPVLRVVDNLLSVRAGIPSRFAVGGMNGVLGALAASVQEDVDDARHDERVALDDVRRGIWRWSVVATMRKQRDGKRRCWMNGLVRLKSRLMMVRMKDISKGPEGS
jgi:hypothetical protein